MTRLRLIADGPGEAAWNMAVDEALFEAVLAGTAPPTLRLYAWEPPGITLGHFQPAAMVDRAACRRRGVEVVRRLTGGGAVFHYGDVTGCLVAPQQLLPRGVRESYRAVSAAQAAALAELGVAAEVGSKAAPLPRRLRPGYDCFARLTECDVGVDGVKIAGSAQRRRKAPPGGVDALLHHSSIVWAPQPPGLLDELIPGAAEVGKPVAVLELVPGASRSRFVERLAAQLAAELGLEVAAGGLTRGESARAAELRRRNLEIDPPTSTPSNKSD